MYKVGDRIKARDMNTLLDGTIDGPVAFRDEKSIIGHSISLNTDVIAVPDDDMLPWSVMYAYECLGFVQDKIKVAVTADVIETTIGSSCLMVTNGPRQIQSGGEGLCEIIIPGKPYYFRGTADKTVCGLKLDGTLTMQTNRIGFMSFGTLSLDSVDVCVCVFDESERLGYTVADITSGSEGLVKLFTRNTMSTKEVYVHNPSSTTIPANAKCQIFFQNHRAIAYEIC